MERGRKVQSIVPDMRISIPEEGNFVPRLHELKIISSSKTRYNPHRQGQEAMKAVDKRANELNNEYITKARNTVWQYCGTAQGTIGPVETKLRPNCATHPATYVLSGHYDIDMLTCKN